MTVLGIDTSAIVCSVALISDEEVLSQKTVSDGLTHSEILLPSVKSVLLEGKKTLSDLSAIAISSGPGSFTGLRIGISTVKGLAVSGHIPCIGVSTLEALAMNAVKMEGKTVCALMDARRGEFYNALFLVKGGNLFRLCPDRALAGSEIAEELSKEDLVLLGDGAEKFVLQNPNFASFLAPEEIRFQSGISVARLGLLQYHVNEIQSCETLSPRYLRLPQAEREWLNKRNRNK